jgi:hypothetical protein
MRIEWRSTLVLMGFVANAPNDFKVVGTKFHQRAVRDRSEEGRALRPRIVI